MSTNAITVTVLSDNHAAYGLAAEHGLALWIETPERNILFDTGRSAAMPQNAETLGIDLSSADCVVLSHGHYDHTGNLPQTFEHAPRASLFFHPDVTSTRYSIHETPKPIGMPAASQAALRAWPAERRHCITAPFRLCEDVMLTGPVPRETAFENTGGPFFLDEAGRQPDQILDDQSLWIATEKGLVVCLGCCHAGVVNTLRYLTRIDGENRIRAVIGGMHLLHANSERLERTEAALKEYAIPHVVPCHCTGDLATEALAQSLGPSVQPGYAGMKLRF